jgi:hypothetical protein
MCLKCGPGREKGGKGNDNGVGCCDHVGGGGSSNSKIKAPEMEDTNDPQAAHMVLSDDQRDNL